MAELLNGFFVLIMVLGLLTGIVALLVLLIMAIRKDRLKAPLWLTGSAFFIAFIGFLGSAIISTVEMWNEPIATIEDESEHSGVEVDGMTDEEIEESIDSALESGEGDDTEYEITEEQQAEFDEEYDKKMAEAKEEREAEEGNRAEDLDNYRDDVDVRDIERNPDEYMNELIVFEGRIIQVIEDDVTTAYRIAVNDDIDRVAYVETLTITLEERLLEDDHVEVYGAFHDLVTYETVMGSAQTIPAFNAHGERIELQETVE